MPRAPRRDAAIIALRRHGYAVRAIAAGFGLSAAAVAHITAPLGKVTLLSRRLPEDFAARYAAWDERRATPAWIDAEIRRLYGTPATTAATGNETRQRAGETA